MNIRPAGVCNCTTADSDCPSRFSNCGSEGSPKVVTLPFDLKKPAEGGSNPCISRGCELDDEWVVSADVDGSSGFQVLGQKETLLVEAARHEMKMLISHFRLYSI